MAGEEVVVPAGEAVHGGGAMLAVEAARAGMHAAGKIPAGEAEPAHQVMVARQTQSFHCVCPFFVGELSSCSEDSY